MQGNSCNCMVVAPIHQISSLFPLLQNSHQFGLAKGHVSYQLTENRHKTSAMKDLRNRVPGKNWILVGSSITSNKEESTSKQDTASSPHWSWKGGGSWPGCPSLAKVKQFWTCQCLSSVHPSNNNQHLEVEESCYSWYLVPPPESLLWSMSHRHGAISQRSAEGALWYLLARQGLCMP